MQVDNRRQNSKSTLWDNHGFRNCATAPCYKLSCNESHAFIGSSIVHCIHGKWNASFPSCKGMLFTYVKKKDIQLLSIRSVFYSVGHLKEKSWRQFPIKWCSQQHTIVHKRSSHFYLNAEKIRRPFQLLTTLVRSNIFVASILKKQESTELLKELIGFPTRAKGR